VDELIVGCIDGMRECAAAIGLDGSAAE